MRTDRLLYIVKYYDFTDRLMKYVESGGINTHSVGYEYDTINNLTKLVETINGITHETSYTYDLDNRVTTVTTDGINKGYAYDAYGRVTTQTVGNESGTVLTETFGYNSGNQITSVTVDTAGQDVAYTYTYDNNGNILSVSDGTNTTSYVYDSANQLLRENNQAADKTWVWTYDNAGNILSKAEYEYTTESLEDVTPTDTISYAYTDDNWGDLLTSYDGVDIDYDEIGNPVDDGTWEYAWQHGRELERMSDGTTTWTFTYDANGMRTSRTDGTTTYKYVYNGGSLVQMTVGSNTLYFTPDTITFNGVTYYYVKNLQGDVTAIVDGSGATVATYVYDAWGNLISDEPAANTIGHLNPIRYRGYIFDSESGFYYLQSRYYDPEVGRFLNADAFASTGQGILGNNMFVYCLNNPTLFADPYGTIPSKDMFPVCLSFDDKPYEETLADYINKNLPEDIKEKSLKQGMVFDKTLDAAAEEVIASFDNTLFTFVISLPFGAPVLTLGTVAVTIGGSFLYGAVKGFIRAVKDVYD